MSLVTEKSLRFFVGTGSAQTKNFLDFDGRSGCDSQAKIAWSALCFNPPCQSKTVPLQTGGGGGVAIRLDIVVPAQIQNSVIQKS